MFIPTVQYMSSAVHTGFGHVYKRINKSRLDCLEHNDRITYIQCCVSVKKGWYVQK